MTLEEIDEVEIGIVENNTKEYNWKKLAEELFELGEVVMKKINRKPGSDKIPTDVKIAEEIGDVYIRLGIIEKAENLYELVENRIDDKMMHLKVYLESGKYKGGV